MTLNKKRVLSFILSAVMLLAMIPIGVSGAEIVASGKCGNLTWTLDDEGTLTISGTGAMPDYKYTSSAPWSNKKPNNVVIEDGVTSIGEYAFYECTGLTSVTIPASVTSIGGSAFDGCTGLTSVTIPDSVTSIGYRAFCGCSALTSVTILDGVTSIGDRAFYGCTGLAGITIPNSVTSIGNYAFSGCTGLKSVTIPDSVTSIGDRAFNGCSGLKSVTIPDSVTSIGDRAFDGCSGLKSVTIGDSVTSIGEYAFYGCVRLENITVAAGNTVYRSAGNCLIEKETKTLILGGKKSVIPNDGSVTSIGKYAFYGCWGLMSVTVPDSVTGIGEYAFYGCSGLTSVTIPGSVTSIGDYAFNGCSGLASVVIEDGMASIGSYAFSGCSGLASVVIEDGVASIGSYAFSGCSGLTSVAIGDGVTGIGNYAFQWCSGLTSVTIPGSVTRIGNYAFSGCRGLTSVVIKDGVTNIGEYAFSGCTGLTSVTIPGSVTRIGNYAFSGCAGLTSVTIPVSVTNIGNSAFSGCAGLTNVTIPDGVTSIGGGAFYGCSQLTSVTIPGSVTSIGDRAFDGCKGLTSVVIKDGVTSIGDSAFFGCSGLTSVTIPVSVTSIKRSAFEACYSLADVYYSALRMDWNLISVGSNNGYLLNAVFHFGCGESLTWTLDDEGTLTISGTGAMTDYADEEHAPWYNIKESIYNVVIEDGVTSIGSNAFSGCSGLTSVTIPDSVTSIGDEAFACCSGITGITIPDSVTSIGESAFEDCSGLTNFTIPANVTNIGERAFAGCSGLTSVTIPDGVTSIGNGTFASCTVLTSVTIPNGVTNIGADAFNGCSGLTSVTIPENVTNIGESAFAGCSGLTNVTIPDGVTSIGGGAFSGCKGLESITVAVGNTVYRSAWDCLIETETRTLIAGCKNSVIPNDGSVTSIGEYAFSGCAGLTSVTIPDSVTSIGEYAFSGCASLADVYYSEFEEWNRISVGPNNEPLLNAVFHFGCGEDLTWTLDDEGTLTISGTGAMTDYDDEEHAPWYNIKESIYNVVIEDGVTSIGSYAFFGCSGLTSVTIPNGVTSIGADAFNGCSGLTGVTIPENVTSIDEGVFAGCTGLTSVTIPNGVTSIGADAFNGCSGLTGVTIPENVTSIGESAFAGCSGLTSVTIPDGVTSIGNGTFASCSGLTSVTIPENVTSIGESAFAGCSGLTSVTIPEGVTTIGDDAFNGCSGLISVTIPDGVTSIGNGTFAGCSGLTSVTIPDGVTSIGADAFNGCSGLTSVTIPENVTNIGESAFNGCSGLTSVTIPENVTSIGDGTFASCSALTSVTIPNGVTSIGADAFNGCSGLMSVTISGSVTSIGKDAFKDDTSLKYIFYGGSKTEWENALDPTNDLPSVAVHFNSTGDHNWNDGTVTTPATCVAGGEMTYKCTVDGCDAERTAATPPDGNAHTWNDGVVTTPATCATEGVKTYTCTGCNETKTEPVAKDAENHTGGTEVGNVKAATCGEDGYTGDTYCKGCGAKLSSGDVIPATGNHTWNDGEITTPASCAAEGVKTYTCTVCKKTRTETIAKDASNHAGGTELRNVKAATCAEEGYTGDTYCKGCGAKLSSGTVVNKTDHHSWNDGEITTAPTCAAEGVKTFTCAVCNQTKTEPIAKNPANHVGGTEVWYAKAATCTEDGYTGYKYCKGCGVMLSSGVVIPATGNHTWNDGEITTAASCAAEGVKTYTCSVCKQTKTETVAKNPANHAGGTELRNVKAATYTEDGYTGDTYCKGCGAKLSSGITIPAIKAPTVSAVSDKTEVAVGDEITVTVKIDNAVGLEEGSAWLSFDTSLFELLRTGNGDISASNVFSHADDEIAQANTEGMIHNLFMYYSGSETNDTVTIYTATFKAKRAGTAAFGFVADELLNLTVGNTATVTINAQSAKVPTVSAVSDKTEVTVGDEITVTVKIDNAKGLEAGMAWLTFDNSLLKLQSTGKGDTIASVSTSTTPVEIAQANTEGQIGNSFAYLESETKDTVTIYTATFKAKGAGTAAFGFVTDELLNLTVGSVATVTVNASPANHSWDAGKVTTAATCSSEGVKTYTCTVCSETKTEPIAKDPANHAGGTELRNVKAATCGTDGYTGDTYCKGCGAKLGSGTVVNKTGHHSWNDGKVTTPATTASGGKITYTCTVCGQTKTEDTPKLPSTGPATEPTTNPKDEPTTILPPVTIPSTDSQKPTVPDKIFNYDGDGITYNEESETIKYASKAALKKSELVGAIESFDGATVVIRDKDGVELSDDAPLGTGATISIVAPNGEVIAVKTIIFIGDVDGDATVNANDARLVLRAAAKLDTLEGIFAAAADVNGDNGINAIDARGILRAAAKLDVLSLA